MTIAVALCVLADIVFRVALPPSAQNTYYRTARAEIARYAPDIQVVGDSAVNHGLIASALAYDDGVLARNDGLSGTRASFSYYLLRRQFEAGHVPRALVIAHTPSFGNPQIGKLTQAFLDWSEIAEAATITTHYMDALYGIIARGSYTLTNRDYFRELLMRGNFEFFAAGHDAGVYRGTSDMTLLDSYRAAKPLNLSPGRFEERRRIGPFRVDDEADMYFRRLLALAKTHGVKVYWLTMPVPEVVAELNHRFDIERGLLSYLEPFEASGDLTILQGPFMVYEDELFQDIIHATPAAAVKFSCYVRTLAPRLAEAVEDAAGELSVERAAALHEQAASRRVLEDACSSEPAATSHVRY